jgi:hypothetical protein
VKRVLSLKKFEYVEEQDHEQYRKKPRLSAEEMEAILGEPDGHSQRA